MHAVDLIIKKRDGGTLTTAEIDFLIEGYTRGTVADEQMAAWAMAVLLRGMDDRETGDLTLAMARSGDQLDLHDVAPVTSTSTRPAGSGTRPACCSARSSPPPACRSPRCLGAGWASAAARSTSSSRSPASASS